ncbi:MAG: hypothetical protein Q9219_005546 [cf. Caloplaca sp. 3 TL-2023]
MSLSTAGDEYRHEIPEELLAQVETNTHLRILTKSMQDDMKEIFAWHELLRSSTAEKVTFQDMWHLFMAGDLVVAESTNSERSPKLYQVSVLPDADFFSSRRPVKQSSTRTEGSQHLVELVYREESVSVMSVLNVDVFNFDFDGLKVGLVERRLHLVSFEGEKNILDLPIYPLRFRKDADEFKSIILERGMKFRELSIPNVYPHRKYCGLSVSEPQEQIDSQVIIDFAVAYRKHPQQAPKFGLRSWIEDDARIVIHFDDHRVDRQRTVELLRANGSLLRTISGSEEVTERMMLLLPKKVYGFVLRSRRWHFLNIDNIRPLERHSDGFENLILPPGVARLVEPLVRTHDPQNMPSFEYEEHHVDLIRGKGKGLIVLLHGAPGVGKTSTAERATEKNMRRNSVVSVFLRVLEFYPGILFLTTNKIGHFDEAFKSRIHVSLYYRSTLKIWKMNLDRLAKSKKTLEGRDGRDIRVRAGILPGTAQEGQDDVERAPDQEYVPDRHRPGGVRRQQEEARQARSGARAFPGRGEGVEGF